MYYRLKLSEIGRKAYKLKAIKATREVLFSLGNSKPGMSNGGTTLNLNLANIRLNHLENRANQSWYK